MSDDNTIVSVVTFDVTPDTYDRVTREITMLMERRMPEMAGYIDGVLLTNESSTRVIIVSEWVSRRTWAQAQWDPDVERAIADGFEGTASYHLEFFKPLKKVVSQKMT